VSVRLPEGAEFYKRTPSFTESSVPAGLLKDHSTKDGTWGSIVVEQGRLHYSISDPRRSASETVVTPAAAAVIEPTIAHRVEPLGTVRFHIRFYREVPSSSPVKAQGIDRR
jgi:tellurite resistance-related uncharacterized protein